MDDTTPLIAHKPAFQRFVEANMNLIKCFQSVSAEEIASSQPAALDAKCNAEKAAVRSILENNELTMTNVVRDRVEILYALNERGIETKVIHTGDE